MLPVYGETTLKKSQRFTDLYTTPKTDPALDQKQVVQAALELLDEGGLDALSMRRLAERLNIKAASLYWHVRDKDHLLALLAEEIVSPVSAPDPSLGWRQQIEIIAQDIRGALRAHRDAARVLAVSGPPLSPNRLRLADQMFSTLMRVGFSAEDTAHAGHLMNDYVTLFVAEETSLAERGQALDSPMAARWMEGLSPEEYPGLFAVSHQLAAVDGDALFRFGLAVLLDGLEMRLARGGST